MHGLLLVKDLFARLEVTNRINVAIDNWIVWGIGDSSCNSCDSATLLICKDSSARFPGDVAIVCNTSKHRVSVIDLPSRLRNILEDRFKEVESYSLAETSKTLSGLFPEKSLPLQATRSDFEKPIESITHLTKEDSSASFNNGERVSSDSRTSRALLVYEHSKRGLSISRISELTGISPAEVGRLRAAGYAYQFGFDVSDTIRAIKAKDSGIRQANIEQVVANGKLKAFINTEGNSKSDFIEAYSEYDSVSKYYADLEIEKSQIPSNGVDSVLLSTPSQFVSIPNGYRVIAWLREYEAQTIEFCYENRVSYSMKNEAGKTIFTCQYFEDGSEEAIKYKANCQAIRVRDKGDRTIGWIKRSEAQAVLQAISSSRDVEIDSFLGVSGLVEYFAPDSDISKTYKSSTRLLRKM